MCPSLLGHVYHWKINMRPTLLEHLLTHDIQSLRISQKYLIMPLKKCIIIKKCPIEVSHKIKGKIKNVRELDTKFI